MIFHSNISIDNHPDVKDCFPSFFLFFLHSDAYLMDERGRIHWINADNIDVNKRPRQDNYDGHVALKLVETLVKRCEEKIEREKHPVLALKDCTGMPKKKKPRTTEGRAILEVPSVPKDPSIGRMCNLLLESVWPIKRLQNISWTLTLFGHYTTELSSFSNLWLLLH